MEFFRKLVAQQLHYRQGHTLITELIIAGEFPVGTVYLSEVEIIKRKGHQWIGWEFRQLLPSLAASGWLLMPPIQRRQIIHRFYLIERGAE